MMFGSILYEGIQDAQKDCEFNDRTMIIVSLAFCVALVLHKQMRTSSALSHRLWEISSTDAVAGVFVVSLLLSLILPKDKSEKVEE